MDYPSDKNNFLDRHICMLNDSYQKLLGHNLIDGTQASASLAKTLFYAPFAVVSHDTAEDPVFNYANLKALELFGFSWEEFIALPSRLSAEPIHRDERGKLLKEVSNNGFISDYSGVRVSKTGRRFLISNAVVWNLYDSNGSYAGQSARFDEWHFLN
jgi:hypothetical protein